MFLAFAAFDMAAAGPLRAPVLYRQATVDEEETSPRLSNVTFDADVITFTGSNEEKPGLFISGKSLRYFSYKINGSLSVFLCVLYCSITFGSSFGNLAVGGNQPI